MLLQVPQERKHTSYDPVYSSNDTAYQDDGEGQRPHNAQRHAAKRRDGELIRAYAPATPHENQGRHLHRFSLAKCRME